jgi:hypothetical protein
MIIHAACFDFPLPSPAWGGRFFGYYGVNCVNRPGPFRGFDFAALSR